MIDAGGWARASCMSVLHIAGQDQYCDKPRHSLVWRAMIGSEHGGISAGRCCYGTQCCRIMDTAEMTISGTPLIPNQDGGLVSVVGEQSDMESTRTWRASSSTRPSAYHSRGQRRPSPCLRAAY